MQDGNEDQSKAWESVEWLFSLTTNYLQIDKTIRSWRFIDSERTMFSERKNTPNWGKCEKSKGNCAQRPSIEAALDCGDCRAIRKFSFRHPTQEFSDDFAQRRMPAAFSECWPEKNRPRLSKQPPGVIKSSSDFYKRFVAMFGTWLHNYTPKTKYQSMQWVGGGEKEPRVPKPTSRSEKLSASIFWDTKGVMVIDHIQ